VEGSIAFIHGMFNEFICAHPEDRDKIYRWIPRW